MFRTNRPDYQAPARPADVNSDVKVPFMQAFISGVAASIVAMIANSFLGWTWWLVPIVFVGVFVWVWWALMGRHNDLLWIKENYEREPSETVVQHITRLNVQVDGGRMIEAEFPIPPDVLLKIARGVVNANRAFSEREWSGNGRLLSSPDEFRTIRNVLMSMDLLRWKDEARRNLGVAWTPEGEATLKALAEGRVTSEEVLRNVD